MAEHRKVPMKKTATETAGPYSARRGAGRRAVKAEGAATKAGTQVKARLVERAFKLLFLMAEMPEGASLMQISRKAELSRATVLRILRTLSDIGVIEYNGGSHIFRLGPSLHRIAAASLVASDIVRVAQPVIKQLCEETRETVCLFRRTGNDRTCVAVRLSDRELSFKIGTGQSRSMVHGAAGKLLLAYMTDYDREFFLGQLSAAERRATELACEQIRHDGLCFTRDELVLGGASLAAPVTDSSGEVAALTILGPAARFTDGNVKKLKLQLRNAAAEIDRRLGAQPAAAAGKAPRKSRT